MRRRDFLRRSALAGGGLTGLAAVPALVRNAYGNPIPVPPAARSVEAGLSAFAARWGVAGPVISVTRFAPYVSDKVFNIHVSDQLRAYVLRLGTAGASLTPGLDPFRHV